MGKSIKLSFSNLFKTIKVISETNLQIPLRDQLTKWSILCIDIKALIKELLTLNQKSKVKKFVQSIPDEKDIEIEMTHLQVCAKLFLRGIYTSDNLYSVKTFPKELSYRLGKGEQFDKSYQWLTLDSAINPDLFRDITDKENDESEADIAINHAELTSTGAVEKQKTPIKSK